MNKRQAKRRACYLVGDWAESAVMQGFESIHEDDEGNPLPAEDAARVNRAVQELAEELFRRAQ